MAKELFPYGPKGRIGTATLPEVVRDLWKSRASGTLYLENGSHTKRIVFANGDIVFAATNVETERLGERLIRSGKIKRSVLELAFQVMERSNERLGTTMVEWGWISPVEMRRAVASQIKDIIYSVFTWNAGDYRFESADEPIPRDLALELKTAEVIYEGARRMSDLRAIRTGIGSPTGILVTASGARLPIPVTKEDGYVLAQLDGRASILDVVSVSPLGEEETIRRIYALLLAGVLERKPAGLKPQPAEPDGASAGQRTLSADEKSFRDDILARHAAMKFGNLYDRLGVACGASEKQIKEAYEEALRSIEPESSFRDHLDDLEKRLSNVRKKVVEAYETLSEPERRRHYDRSLSGDSPESTVASWTSTDHTVAPMAKSTAPDPVKANREAQREAELYFMEANRSWQAGDYFDAVASMNEAVRLDSGKATYHLVLARWLAENPSCAEAAQQHFERAIALDPHDREAHLGLAHLLETEGMADKARGIYDKLSLPSKVT